MQIGLAEEGDIPRILELSNWAAAHTTANFATEPELLSDWLATYRATHAFHPWLVARPPGGPIAGFARSGPHKSRGAYRWAAEVSVYLDPAFHGQRLGTALYEALLRRLRAQGYMTLLAGITAGHVASERLHARAGFVRCAIFHRVGWKDDRWHDVGYWELQLRDAGPPSAIRTVRDVEAELSSPAPNATRAPAGA